MMSEEQLREIEGRLAKASKGPWKYDVKAGIVTNKAR